MPIYVQYRAFEIRIEDILILITVLFGLLRLSINPIIYISPMWKPILIYVSITVIVSLFAVLGKSLNITRALLYNLKEIEYFLIALIIANVIRSRRDLKIIFNTILIAGGLNIIWVAIQLISNNSNSLFYFAMPAESYLNPHHYIHYGLCTLGEYSPLSVSMYFAFNSFLAYAIYLSCLNEGGRKRWFYALLGIIFSMCSIGTGEKVAVIYFLVAIIVVLYQTYRKVKIRKIWFIFAISILSLLLFMGFKQIIKKNNSVIRVFDIKAYRVQSDRSVTWQKVFDSNKYNMIWGVGKGNIIYMDNGDALEEIHNHYFKILLESGIIGLAAFLWILIALAAFARRLTKNSISIEGKAMGRAVFWCLMALLFTACVQDAFKPILPNELFWLYVGLCVAIHKIEKCNNNICAV